MYTPDFHAAETRRDQAHYEALLAAAERADMDDAYEIAQGQPVYNAIRALRPDQLTRHVVRQILQTLACQMTAAGFDSLDVAGIEDTAEDF